MDTPSINNARSYLDFEGLGQLKGQARQNSSSALRETAQQFEAMLLQQMLKTMRQTVEKNELTDSAHVETFENMFDKEVALKIAKRGGIGLADMLVASMAKQEAQKADHAQVMQNLSAPQPAKAFALNPPQAGLPLQQPAPAKGLPLRAPGLLPLNLPPKPLGND
ncbi:MAG: rod-binding protein [Hylemonella sp.]